MRAPMQGGSYALGKALGRTVAKRTNEDTGMMKKNKAMLHARMRAILTAWLASLARMSFSACPMASSHPVGIKPLTLTMPNLSMSLRACLGGGHAGAFLTAYACLGHALEVSAVHLGFMGVTSAGTSTTALCSSLKTICLRHLAS